MRFVSSAAALVASAEEITGLRPNARSRGPKSFLLDVAGVGASAACLLLSFPSFDLHGLAWVALVPLLLRIKHSGLLGTFLLSFATGLAFYGALLRWALTIDGFNPFNFAAAIIVCAIFLAVFGLLIHWFDRSIPTWNTVTFPVTWVLVEYLRSQVGFLAFPWGTLGYSQYAVLPVAQVAAFTGVQGVSFLVAASNAVLAESIHAYLIAPARQSAHVRLRQSPVAWAALGFAGILSAMFLHEVSSADQAISGQLRVGLVQGNIAWSSDRDVAYRRMIFETYHHLTLKAAASQPDLVAWPASTVPGRIPHDYAFVKLLSDLARQAGSYLIVGATGQDKLRAETAREPATANSTFVFSPEGKIIGRYDKIRLLPFDEYVPLRRYVQWPRWIVNPNVIDLEPGKDLTVFTTPKATFGIQDCWENLFPGLFRKLAARDIDFVVSTTNEGFTDSPAAHHQMFAMNTFRAIENHITIVRTATTGVSAIIDPKGRVLTRVTDQDGNDVNVRGHVVAAIPLSKSRTFYTRHGDWFVIALIVIVACFTVVAFARRHDRTG